VSALIGLAAAACKGGGSSGHAADGGTGGSGATTGGTSGTGGSAQSGTGGKGGSTAGSGGASAGSGGLVVTGRSMTDACYAYAYASCARQMVCQGADPSSCIHSAASCPDVVSSPGATRTIDGLFACATEMESFPCERLDAGELPECVTPGERQLGESCLYPSQCASLICKNDSGCGVCARAGAVGDDCSAPEAGCRLDAYCDTSALECVSRNSSGTWKALGEVCQTNECASESYCDTSSSPSVCTAYPSLGQSCSAERTCQSDSYCAVDGLVCKARPAEGDPCGVDGFNGYAMWCVEGLVCKRQSTSAGTCVQAPKDGEPCLTDPETGAPLPACEMPATCDSNVTPAVCKLPAKLGETCNPIQGCEANALCACPDDVCTTTKCIAQHIGGGNCDEATAQCLPGYSCVAGTCQGVQSQGLFEASCGG
jgi:hypothetical protein